MQRSFAFLGAGIIVGAVLMLTLYGRSPDLEQLADVRDLTADIQIDSAEIDEHREDSYRSLDTVEDLLKLPTDFARREAAHVLAGRSDSAKVQELIADASRISDTGARDAMLEIFFTRFTGLDPRSALAVSRFEQFRNDPDIERVVWVQWARRDLDSALFEATVQATFAERYRATQALFAAHGHYDNAVISRIRDALQIDPDSANRSLFIQDLVNRSPEEAIAYINGMKPGSERDDFLRFLAGYLGMTDAEGAMEYADLLQGDDLQKRFRSTLTARLAEIDPVGVLEEILAGPQTGQLSPGLRAAIRAVAKRDADLAMSYLERFPSGQKRQSLATVIARELVEQDIDQALEWVRDNPVHKRHNLELSVLSMIARKDPRRAFDEAVRYSSDSSSPMRSVALQSVVRVIVSNDAQLAIELIQEMPEGRERNQTAAAALHRAVEVAPDATIGWLTSLPKEQANAILRGTSGYSREISPETVMRLLPLVDAANRAPWLQQTARQIATTYSPDEAFSFIRQFEGTSDYESMRGVVLDVVAQTNPLRALELVDSLPDGQRKDRAMATIVGSTAQSSPDKAVDLLNRISNEQARSRAISGLARQWATRDPEAAMHWAEQMPAGTDRDDAVVAITGFAAQPSDKIDKLIEAVSDPRKRSRARMQSAVQNGRGDPARVKLLLEDPDILPEHKEQIRQMLEYMELGYF